MENFSDKANAYVQRLLGLCGRLEDLDQLKRSAILHGEATDRFNHDREVVRDEVIRLLSEIELEFSGGVESQLVGRWVQTIALLLHDKNLLTKKLQSQKELIDLLLDRKRKAYSQRTEARKKELDAMARLGRATNKLRQIKMDRIKGAHVAQGENRQLKREAFGWLDANGTGFKNMSNAANALEKIVPVKWRTAYAWAREWKKQGKK